MNNDQAKLILSVYRPHGQDASDPAFAEALLQAERDPSVGSWFKEEQHIDSQLSTALASVAPPADAKAMLKAMTSAAKRPPRWRWLIAMAASLAVLLSSTFVVVKNRSRGLPLPEGATVAQLAANLSDHHASLGLVAHEYWDVRQWLAERGGPLPENLPTGLTNLRVVGCQNWKTTRGKVSLVCFVGEGRQMVHLYIFEDPADHPGLAGVTQPRIEREGNWSLASWKGRDCVYVLGVPADASVPIESYLGV